MRLIMRLPLLDDGRFNFGVVDSTSAEKQLVCLVYPDVGCDKLGWKTVPFAAAAPANAGFDVPLAMEVDWKFGC